LSEAGIKKAAVIDEAFDPPALSTIAQELAEFFTLLEATPIFRKELEEKGIECGDREKFENEGWLKLWNARTSITGELGAQLRPLFEPHEQMRVAPETVAKYLEELGVSDVCRIGANGNVPNDVPLVFLDYDLESGARNMQLQLFTRRSQKIAEELSHRNEAAPFLVLFSNRPDVPNYRETFRSEAGYLRGTFAFISKEHAVDQTQFRQLLLDCCLGHPALRLTQQFFFALKQRIDVVAESVKKDVMQLDVQDYAFIQRLGLQDDGALLGEYLLDIFGAVLSHELRSGADVQKARRELDALDFDKRHLPFSDQPSIPIQRIYRAILTEPGISDCAPHPQVGETKFKISENDFCPYPPLLMLGDIFAGEVTEPIYVIVNPACALQYSPVTRPPLLDTSVYLLAGRLEALQTPIRSQGPKRMEWIEHGGGYWRVLWEHEKVTTVTLGDFESWRVSKKLRRITRLSLPYALALQHHWTSQLGRVGLPVNPPFFEARDLDCYLLSTQGEYTQIGETGSRHAIMCRQPRDSKEVSHFTLTRAGRDYLWQQLTKALELLEDQAMRKAAAQQLLDADSFWTDLLEVPRRLAVGRKQIDKSTPKIIFAWDEHPTLKELKRELHKSEAEQGIADHVAMVVVLRAIV
jgi:hypothetical protein